MIESLYARDADLVNNNIGCDVTFTIFKHPPNSENWVEDFTLAPSQIVSESMELKQSICDDRELKIGGCIPSQLTLDVMNIGRDAEGNRIDLSGKRIAVTVNSKYLSSALYPGTALHPSTDLYPSGGIGETGDYVLFIGQIYSYNRRTGRIVAFDRLYYSTTVLCKQRILNYLIDHEADYFTIKTIIDEFFPLANIRVRNPGRLINYNSYLSMMDYPFSNLASADFTYNDLVKQLCELNGAFLVEDMPGENLQNMKAQLRAILPYQTVNQTHLISNYSQLKYDDFVTKPISYFQLSYNGGARYIEKTGLSEGGNYISKNILTQCTASSEVQTIIRNLDADYNGGTDCVLGDVYVYRPFKASIFNRWWVQVGDRIRIPTVNDDEIPYVESIVLSRKIKGIRNIRVEIEAKGVETLGKEHDDISNE